MRSYLLLATTSLALATCGSENADTNGDGRIGLEEAEGLSDEFIKPEPGMWRATITLVDVDSPGGDEKFNEVLDVLMKQGSSKSHEFCVSKEDSEKGIEALIEQSQQGQDCTVEKLDAIGNGIETSYNAVTLCTAPESGEVRTITKGVATSTTSETNMTMDLMPVDGQAVKATVKVSQKRIGDCEG